MRVAFFGTSAFAVPSLERLVKDGHDVLCVTQPDRPQGRGLQPEPSPVKTAAQRLGIELRQPERLSAASVADAPAALGVVAAYGKLIRRDLLDWPSHGMLGVHPSLLPKYRGAAPVAWTLLNGEQTTGLTIFVLNEALDAGPIITRRAIEIGREETTQTLTQRLAEIGAEELAAAVALLASGSAHPTAQDESQATFAPKLTKEQGRIDWQQPAEIIDRLIRALQPWPGAVTAWQGQPVKIWQAQPQEGRGEQRPGTVLEASERGILVQTGSGALRVMDLQLPGKRRMSVKDLLAGRRVKVGELLGDMRHA